MNSITLNLDSLTVLTAWTGRVSRVLTLLACCSSGSLKPAIVQDVKWLCVFVLAISSFASFSRSFLRSAALTEAGCGDPPAV